MCRYSKKYLKLMLIVQLTNVNNALKFLADENNISQYLKIIYKNSYFI